MRITNESAVEIFVSIDATVIQLSTGQQKVGISPPQVKMTPTSIHALQTTEVRTTLGRGPRKHRPKPQFGDIADLCTTAARIMQSRHEFLSEQFLSGSVLPPSTKRNRLAGRQRGNKFGNTAKTTLGAEDDFVFCCPVFQTHFCPGRWCAFPTRRRQSYKIIPRTGQPLLSYPA